MNGLVMKRSLNSVLVFNNGAKICVNMEEVDSEYFVDMSELFTTKDSDNTTLKEKKIQVLGWLDQLFDGDEIQFPVKEEEIAALHEMMKRNNDMDQLCKNYLETINEEVLDYVVEGERLNQTLQEIEMTAESFSQSGRLSIKTLSEVAAMLGLNNMNLSSYARGIGDLSTGLSKLKKSVKDEDEEALELEQKTKETLNKCSQLRKLQESFEQHVAVQSSLLDKQAKETTFLEAKSKQYEKTVRQQEAVLANSGLTEDIRHESLIDLAKDLGKLQDELKPLQTKLNAYHSLPPDIPLAKVKVEVARRELEQLDTKLCEDIDSLKL